MWAVDTASGDIVGFLRFEGAVQEIYDVQLLRGATWPEIVEPGAELVGMAIELPPEAMAELVVARRRPAAERQPRGQKGPKTHFEGDAWSSPIQKSAHRSTNSCREM